MGPGNAVHQVGNQSGTGAIKEGKMKKIYCHCCEKLSTDAGGKPKQAPICWMCISNGGSIERKCSVKHKRK